MLAIILIFSFVLGVTLERQEPSLNRPPSQI
jgi:hypothetical protein